MSQIITLYTFNLFSVTCQLYFNKTRNKKELSAEGHSALDMQFRQCWVLSNTGWIITCQEHFQVI